MSAEEERLSLRRLTARWRENGNDFDFARKGDPEATRQALIKILTLRPTDRDAAAYLVDLDVRLGHYSEAWATCTPQLKENASQTLRLQAAVAGAMVGYVFPGQVGFANQFSRRLGSGDLMPKGLDLQSARASAWSGVASEAVLHGDLALAQEYFERAREFAPQNAFINYELGFIYLADLQYEAARAAYAEAAEYGAGDIREYSARQVDWIDGQLRAGVRSPIVPTKP